MKTVQRWTNTPHGYGRGAITAHWHKSIGILLMALVLGRLVWRGLNSHPLAIPGHKRWEKRLASVVHGLLYGLLLTVPVSGYLISTADGRPVNVFGWFSVPALMPAMGNNQADIAGLWHFWLATLLVSLAGLHALGALKHHIIDRDRTLSRMLKPAKEPNS